MSGEFQVKKGVLQGDTLDRFLFVTVLDWGFTIFPRRSQRYSAEKVSEFDFGDDI